MVGCVLLKKESFYVYRGVIPAMPFSQLGLCSELASAVRYNSPTPVQQEAIPAILDGRDILAAAQTGTGKTAAFTLPLLERLREKPEYRKRVRALVVTPTRELAAQIQESVETYGKNLPFRSCVIFGGVKINPQIARLRQRTDIVIATPGRLLDLVQQKALDLSAVEILVLDEADRMLDMGFVHDIRRILKLLPKKRQNLMFSATYSNEIEGMADKLMQNPFRISVARKNTAAETVKQAVHPVDKTRKRELLSYLIGSNNWRQVLVFTRTKHGANRLTKQLELDGLKSAAIHGNKSQGARTRALREFKENKIRVLVATDIAARGLDIDKLPHVVNYDLPQVPEDYVHRIGRTGRAENDGMAVSLVSIDEADQLRAIERLLKQKLEKVVIAGFEPDPNIKAEPAKKPARRNAPAKRRSSASNRRRTSSARHRS
jgi:ATP-dependent RNA helicase RhlE